jgi:DNA-binding CsgD family transcriptional regulator
MGASGAPVPWRSVCCATGSAPPTATRACRAPSPTGTRRRAATSVPRGCCARGPGRRLRVTLLAGGREDVLVLREDRDQPLSPDALAAALPISRREAEVLALVAGGHTNAGIAAALTLSPRTVGRHVERLLARLGVPNRAAATAAALAALGEHSAH